MAESPEDSPGLVQNQSSPSHPHVKVKFKRSSASWEVHIDDEEEKNDALGSCGKASHIFCEFKNTGTKYKNRVRSRAANLKDPRNPELRRRVVQGEITPLQIATMSAQEMASEEVKKFRRQVSQESIQRRQVPHSDGTMTDMFKCENCGRENCCYNQYRGFSADGPIASPFVFCMDCGNRWKFF
ncbi:TCEA3 [Branchiostoma lanceolatum]|uniref:TCEA3 protein n=1 Tax=Branchiostoma lanceolatum TaxID=7740 RepID=A0A8K0EPP0_BRALA|nr:TCEA3 [Branchiostoma lanceolatum]